MKQAVLGATGNIGNLLLQELLARGIDVVALSRQKPERMQKNVEYVSVDAENGTDLIRATKNIDVLYSTLAVPYSTAMWEQKWPLLMDNLITAAKVNSCKLVFLDNVYMYGQVKGPMTEATEFKPVAKKGAVRAQIARQLQDAMNSNAIQASIGRSADFYGFHTNISNPLFIGAYENHVAKWIGELDVLRTFNYTADNAKALAILGNEERANQRVWHLPAAKPKKGTDFIHILEDILSVPLRVDVVSGISEKDKQKFANAAPELVEMMYQYNQSYIFDSSAFERTFNMRPTSYEEGFKRTIRSIAEERSR